MYVFILESGKWFPSFDEENFYINFELLVLAQERFICYWQRDTTDPVRKNYSEVF